MQKAEQRSCPRGGDGEAKQGTTEAYKCREMGPPIPPVEPAITGARRTPAMPAAAPCCFVSVTKSDASLVGPAESTPGGALPLSSIDRIYFKNLIQETVHVFTRGGREAARVVREALSRALVHYYPMAGRLVRPDSEGGVAHVACTGEGAWFVEATASCTLEDVDWLQQHPLPIPAEELFPCPSDTAGMIMMIQAARKASNLRPMEQGTMSVISSQASNASNLKVTSNASEDNHECTMPDLNQGSGDCNKKDFQI